MQTDQRQIGDLFVRSFCASDTPKKAVVLCHGFGAPGTDLVGLAPELVQLNPALSDVKFYFPEAPLELPMMFGARAWWMIDMGRLEAAIQSGDTRQMADEVPDGLKTARQKLQRTIDLIVAEQHITPHDIVVGGFSQGAMLATETALFTDDAFAGLAIFSGALLNQDTWRKKAEQRRGFRVFQSHGQDDPLLSFAQSQDLEKLFSDAGFDNSFHAFNGGHTIDRQALNNAAQFIGKCFT